MDLRRSMLLSPRGLRTGLVLIEVSWRGSALCAPGWIRIIPAGLGGAADS